MGSRRFLTWSIVAAFAGLLAACNAETASSSRPTFAAAGFAPTTYTAFGPQGRPEPYFR